MREFFGGWRRTVGVVTLVMACVFAAGWVRSFSATNDSIKIGPKHLLLSSHGVAYWYAFYDGDRAEGMPQESMMPGLKYRWKWVGYGIIASDQAIWQQYSREFGINYWYIVSPLTLLSAYLLLSKPRERAPKTIEPAPTTGA